MKYNTYTPRPADTSSVQLSEELMQLTEEMARNVHDVWAVGRIADGWTWGPDRDDVKKENPCLMPYEDLPNSEKEYDRKVAIETLKLILLLGYKVEKRVI